MKKLILAAALVAGTSAAASAADLPTKAPVLAPAPIATWAGLYVGLNAGGFWGNADQSVNVTSPGSFFGAGCFPAGGSLCVINTIDVTRAGAQSVDAAGFIGGAQIGYNWQFGATVFGVEADIQSFSFSESNARSVLPFSGAASLVTVANSVSSDWLATLRARLGFVLAPTWMAYVTGGLAVANIDTGWGFSETSFGNVAAASFSDTEWGWTLGAGAEVKLTNNWSIGLEYLYVNFDDITTTVPVVLPLGGGPTPQNFTQTTDLDAHIVRAKLNYKF